MTQDHYLGRGAVDGQAARALDAALRDMADEGQFRGTTVGSEEAS